MGVFATTTQCSRCGGKDPSALPGTGGQCGDNAYWIFDAGTNTMIIYGSGSVTSDGWSTYKNSIRTVEVQPGITEIGTELFYQHANLQKAIIL
jgi:hypothetical protein